MIIYSFSFNFCIDIIPDLKTRDRQIKPWLSNKKDLEDELLKLGLRLNFFKD